MKTPPPRQDTPRPEETVVSDLSRPSDPPRPPGPGPQGETIVTDLSGRAPQGETIVTDLSGPASERTVIADLSRPTEPGTQPPDALRETQATRLQSAPATRPPGRTTDVTHLHVEAGKMPHDPQGTHRGEVWGDFRLGDLLGRGGMGAVYRGVQISLDRPVAIKVLPPHLGSNENFRSRFQLEAKAVAKLSSPHVIQVYGAGTHQGQHYFAMEYVEGDDLAKRIKEGLKPTYAEALDFVTQAARGLAAAGELGIVHRDIKPANMMVTKKGILKLMDFGLVKLASDDHSLTMSGTIMGTVTYFSPEQGRGEKCDQRTDIYALGVVFYEVLTGQLPFSGGDATSIIYQHIHAPPKAPREIDPQIPEGFQAVVLKCMQKRAEDRYTTANELLADLERLRLGQLPRTALADPEALRSGATVIKSDVFAQEKKGRGALVAVALVALAGGGAAAWALWPPKVDPHPGGSSGPVTTVGPAVLVAPPPAVAAPKPDQGRELLDAGRLVEARQLADQALRVVPEDPDWIAIAKKIDAARAAELVTRARTAFTEGDMDTAGTLAATARGLSPEAEGLDTLLKQLADREGARAQRTRALTQAENLLGAGDWAQAEKLLTTLEQEWPGDQAIAGALGRAKVAREHAESRMQAVKEHLSDAEQSMARKDYDGAQLSYTAAKNHDPKNAAATAGLERVNHAKTAIVAVRAAFDAALAAGDMATADARLAELREAAPGSATLALAEGRLAQSKLSGEQKRQEAEAREARLGAEAKALLARLEDPKQPLAELERATTAFAGQLEAGRPERALLERRLDDRRSREQVSARFAELDLAVLAKSAEGIGRAVADAEFASALAALGRYDGLVFKTRLVDFVRTDSKAQAKAVVRHALAVFPERDLTYLFDLQRDDAGWRIVGAHLQTAAP